MDVTNPSSAKIEETLGSEIFLIAAWRGLPPQAGTGGVEILRKSYLMKYRVNAEINQACSIASIDCLQERMTGC
jgi:hypothetical protein